MDCVALIPEHACDAFQREFDYPGDLPAVIVASTSVIRGHIDSYTVIPHPARSLDEIMRVFLSEPIPRISVVVGVLSQPEEHEPRVRVEELDLDEPFLMNRPIRLDTGDDEIKLVLAPIYSFSMDHRNRLEMLWQFPASRMNPCELLENTRRLAVMLVFHDRQGSGCVSE